MQAVQRRRFWYISTLFMEVVAMILQSTFPEPPRSIEHLDAQQQALIHEQETEIKRLQVPQ